MPPLAAQPQALSTTVARVSAHRTRREFFAIAGATGLAVTAACSRPGGTGGTAASGTVTVKHLFGETTLSAPPKRVVSAGLTEQDDLLAVGVAPVAVTSWFGDPPFGVWPWAQSKLGEAKPAVLSLNNGIAVEPIAALKPDLIVAVNAGLDADTYKKLAEIAPTIAQSGADAFFEPWKEQAAAVGAAVFKPDEMERLIQSVEEKLTGVAQAHPTFRDRTAVLLDGRIAGDTVTATVGGWRTDFLSAMGLGIPESVKALPASGGQAAIARDELAATLDGADVLIWCTDGDAEQSALLADPTVAALRATARKSNVFTDAELSAAIAFASPLSYPVVADRLPPLLSPVLG